MHKFKEEVTAALAAAWWQRGDVLQERFVSRGSLQEGEGARRRLTREVVQAWARTQAFLLKGEKTEDQVRILVTHIVLRPESALKPGNTFSERTRAFLISAPAATPREARELRAVPLQFLCCLLDTLPELGPTLLSHFSEALERLWLCSLVEQNYAETRHVQSQFARLLAAATLQHATPAAPVLTALGLLPNEMLTSRDSFQRMDVLNSLTDSLATQLGGRQNTERGALERTERLLRAACAQMLHCSTELHRASQARYIYISYIYIYIYMYIYIYIYICI